MSENHEASSSVDVDQTEEVSSEEQVAAEPVDPLVVLTADLQRLQAEYSNYRKRVERDRSLAHEIAVASVLTELLPILDDFDRAAEHGELTGGFKAVADQFLATTDRIGLKKFGEAPSTFDPNIHDAMLHETSSEVSETTVTKILQPGYSFKERIIRPARVTVTDPE